MPRTFLGLGGNVGHVAATFKAAIGELADDNASLRFIRTSSLYRTAAIGANAGEDFLNAVAEIETDLSPHELLKCTQSVETSLGRTRNIHWGPRSVDIDILLYGQEIVDEAELTIPHPALWYRRFVLDPLAELAPDTRHPAYASPGLQQPTIDQLRQRMLIRPFRLSLAGDDHARRDQLVADLQVQFPTVEFESLETGRPIAHGEETQNRLTAVLNAHDLNIAGSSVVQAGMITAELPLPDNNDDGHTFLTAVVTAATDTPVIVEGPIHL